MNWLAWALLSALFAGITAVLAKAGVAGVDARLATALRTSVVVVLTWAVALPAWSGGWPSLAPRTWIFLAFSGIATGLSWLCYFRALQLGPVTKVAPLDKLSVVVAIALAALFLGERPGAREVGGIVLIVAGALLLAGK